MATFLVQGGIPFTVGGSITEIKKTNFASGFAVGESGQISVTKTFVQSSIFSPVNVNTVGQIYP